VLSVPRNGNKLRGQNGRVAEFFEGQLYCLVAGHPAGEQLVEAVLQMGPQLACDRRPLFAA
jgi:hypothetical protein